MSQARWLVLFCLSAALLMATDSMADISQQAKQAAAAMQNSNFEEAARIYRKLAAALPTEPGIRLSLAAALHSSGHYPEALRELESIRTSEKQNAKFWMLLGLTYLKLGQSGNAVMPLRHAVELDATNTGARLELASALLESHQYAPAEEQFQRLASDDPRSPKAWQGLALSELGASREAFESLKRTAPRSSFLYGLAAIAAASAGNKDQAVSLYEQALAAQPAAAWMRAELVSVQSGSAPSPCTAKTYACRFVAGEGATLARETFKLKTAEGWYWATRVYSTLAQQSMQAMAALPQSAEQHVLMARMYAENRRTPESLGEWREAAKLAPEDREVQGGLAEALWSNRHFDEAVPLLTSLVASMPARADWQYELGDALFNLGKPEDGLPHLQQAVTLAPGLLPAHARMGEVLLGLGRPADAVVHLERASGIDRDGAIHFQLATAYRRLGKADLAAKAMARKNELAEAAKAKQ